MSASTGQGSCEAITQTVVCQLETLAAGGSALATVTADVAPTAAGSTIVNTATAASNELIRFPDLIARPELLDGSRRVTPIPPEATPPTAPAPPITATPPISPALRLPRRHRPRRPRPPRS